MIQPVKLMSVVLQNCTGQVRAPLQLDAVVQSWKGSVGKQIGFGTNRQGAQLCNGGRHSMSAVALLPQQLVDGLVAMYQLTVSNSHTSRCLSGGNCSTLQTNGWLQQPCLQFTLTCRCWVVTCLNASGLTGGCSTTCIGC